MTNQLSFHTTTIKPFNNKNQVWITSSDLAKLLEYKSSDSVTKIYNRNSDEFTSKMTETVNLTAPNNLKQTVRIFSLRGSHLIAMLAKTKVAKEVRKWLLDLADKEMGIIDTISVEQQQAIRQAVSQRAYRNGEHHQAVYHKLYAEFKIPRYQDLPASKFEEAIKFLGGIKERDFKLLNIDNMERQQQYLIKIQEYNNRVFDHYNDNLAQFISKNIPHLHYNIYTSLSVLRMNIELSLNHIRSELPRGLIV